MKNFTYNSPTKIHFGKNQIDQLNFELQEYKNKTILLVFGRQAIKKLGIYDKIYTICNELNITIIEESNVQPNPEITSVRSGIQKCINHNVSLVLGAGGGSSIDCAKAIALGRYSEVDIWDVYLGKHKLSKSLPVGVVITLAATGSETNGNSVISNNETNEKRAVGYPISIPQFAIIDPEYTLSVNRHHTIAGSIDIILHSLEQYFSNTTRTETSDYMIIGLIESVIENTNKIIAGDDSYDNRSNISWASTIALNWILGVDKVGDWATHRLSYPVTKFYDITHGYALVSIFSSWMKIALKYNPETMNRKLELLGSKLFDTKDPIEVINNIDTLFTGYGANTRLKDYKLSLSVKDAEMLAQNATALGNVGTVVTIDYEKAKEIFILSIMED